MKWRIEMKKIMLVLAVMLMAGCSASKQTDSVDTEHTAQNSLDWAGVYEGVLPCADCEGIKTTLTLTYDGKFKLEEAYEDGNLTYIPQAMTGNIVWDKSRPVIHLSQNDEQRIYFVGEGYVKAYDIEGNPIESELNYTLNQIQVFEGDRVIKEIEVGPKLIPCQGVAPMQCLQVKHVGDKSWSLHYEAIEGFDYKPGFIYRLKIAEMERDDAPADRSTIIWKLVSVISKTRA